MARENGPPHDFEVLVAQCLARIRVSGQVTGEEAEALAERVAAIVSDNRRRGRVPRHESPHPASGIPDSYVDEVLNFLRQEDPRLQALRAGDEAAWQAVLDLLEKRAYGYLLRGGMDTGQARQMAQDFAQACAVTLWEQALERFPYDTHFDAWVSRIAAYEVSQFWRSAIRQREQRALSLDAVPELSVRRALHDLLPDKEAARALAAADARVVLAQALAQLPTDEQREVVLRQLGGQSDQEIAEALGRSVQSVYNLRNRAFRFMRRVLGRGFRP